MKKNENRSKLFKILFILALLSNRFKYDDYLNYKKTIDSINQTILKIYIMAHKDFINYRYNKVYSIVIDDKSQLKNKYNLNVIYANEGKLYQMNRAYSEMSQLYFIYQLYKNGTFSSKYIGLNHYRRFFDFADDIPDLDKIFQNNDVILNSPIVAQEGMKGHYCKYHLCKKYDEIINIIEDIRPEYYETALKTRNEKLIYFCNLFIMKKNDFLKYCEFMFDILFEFDRRNNFSSDDDVLNYTKDFYSEHSEFYYQSRMESFLSERIGNIFYYHHFQRIKTFDFGNYHSSENRKEKLFPSYTIIGHKVINETNQALFLSMVFNCVLLIIFSTINFFQKLYLK